MTNTPTPYNMIPVADTSFAFDRRRHLACCSGSYENFVSKFEVPVIDGEEGETHFVGIVEVGTALECPHCKTVNVMDESGTFNFVATLPTPFVPVSVEPMAPACDGHGGCGGNCGCHGDCGKPWFPKDDGEWAALVSGFVLPDGKVVA